MESPNSILSSFCPELLKGNDPLNMDLFFEDVNKVTPEVEQIVKIVLKQIKREKTSNNIKLPQRRGVKWSEEEEDHQLKQEYLNKLPFKDICKNHGRSTHAVQLRIMKLFPEIVGPNEREQKHETVNKIVVGSKVTYLDKKYGEIKKIEIVAPRYEEKPTSGTGAYYELETRREVIPPVIAKNQISSESVFAKRILGLESGKTVEIFPNKGSRYTIEILKVQNENGNQD